MKSFNTNSRKIQGSYHDSHKLSCIFSLQPSIIILSRGGAAMKKYLCEPCGYIYDPELGDPDGGIEPGTAFEDIPDDWVCPICGLGKEVFVEL